MPDPMAHAGLPQLATPHLRLPIAAGRFVGDDSGVDAKFLSAGRIRGVPCLTTPRSRWSEAWLPPIHSPVFLAGANARQQVREKLRQMVKDREITIRDRHGSPVDVDELVDEIFGPEPKPSTAAIAVVIGLLCMLVGWIVFVLVYRPG